MRYVGTRQVVIDGTPAAAPSWAPSQDLSGETVLIVGGGPQLATLDLEVVRGHRFIAVNSSCRRLRPIATAGDILYFTDNSWNENRPELAASWPGPVVTGNRNVKIRLGDNVRYLDVVALTETFGAAPDHVQASSGHIAACLAAVMGAREIVLVGFECGVVGGRTHGHGDYSAHDVGVFAERFLPGWAGLAPAFRRLGVTVLNATPASAVLDYPFVPLKQALA